MATRVVHREPRDPQFVFFFLSYCSHITYMVFASSVKDFFWGIFGVSFSRELYKDALENVSAYNSRLRFERRLRIPFIDAQTGIAMNNCNLWISKLERRPGKTPQYIYSYPAKRWRKKKRPTPVERASEVKVAETGGKSLRCCQGRGRDSQLSLS